MKGKAPVRLLSVDWDFFFPNPFDGATIPKDGSLGLYDWGHKETRLFIETLWPMRAGSFLGNGLQPPTVNKQWRTFWKRFAFSPKAKLYYHESHVGILDPKVIKGVTEVVNYDAHHDCGYTSPEDFYDCGNWALAYWVRGCDISVVYPSWRKRFEPEDSMIIKVPRRKDRVRTKEALPYDRVFLCRSGAWTPSWCDDLFNQFLNLCPLPKVDLGLVDRKWDPTQAEEHARNWNIVRKQAV